MRDPAIRVDGLCKRFRVPVRSPGIAAALRAVVRRRYLDVDAVQDLTFTIASGERVGLLGPNGAGKTTTLKMMSGLLYPSSGEVRVNGHTPSMRRSEFLRSVSLVMGQKRQLSWDLPAIDTFELNRVVFDVPRAVYRERLDELTGLLEIGDVMYKPVRQLSLGERMKCELVAALLHAPKVLFLDEPTIGMDVSMQLVLRNFIRTYNERHGATLILTSHYMGDVAALCPRILVIDQGRLRFDGAISELTREIRPLRRVRVRAPNLPDRETLERMGHVVELEQGYVVLEVDPKTVGEVVTRLVTLPGSTDLVVEEAPLEDVMRHVFRSHANPT